MVKSYFKTVVQVSSLVFSILVTINLVLNKERLFDLIEFFLFIALASGVLIFIVDNQREDSAFRLYLNQVLYLLLIFAMIAIGNYVLAWELGLKNLLLNYGIVLGIYYFIKFVMYENDKKVANEINEVLTKRKQEKK